MTVSRQQHPGPQRSSRNITGAFRAVASGVPGADENLAALVYEPLRAIAARQLRSSPDADTLDSNALVHEAYLVLTSQLHATWRDRAHFFAVAARVMRRIIVDHARKHRAMKRGGEYRVISLDDAQPLSLSVQERADELIALDEALDRLERLDPRLSKVVDCRFFAGLTEAETAEVLGVTPRTVARQWRKAREWLHAQLRPADA